MKKILFCAEQIASFNTLYPVYKNLIKEYCADFSSAGPSLIKTAEFGLKNRNFEEISDVKYDIVIRGASDGVHENRINKNFFEKKIKVISIFDSWCNYTERFFYNDDYIFPDYIVFQDERSEKEFLEKYTETFSDKKIISKILGNPVTEKFNSNNYVPEKYDELEDKILIISDHNNTEKLIEKIFENNFHKKYFFEIKYHPRDDKGIYKKYGFHENTSEYRKYKLILGTGSFMMLELKYIGCRVLAVSNNGKKSFLKFDDYNIPEITDLNDLKVLFEKFYLKENYDKPLKNFISDSTNRISNYIKHLLGDV